MTNTDMSLRDAAQAVIDRWETPLWKDALATAVFIADLRDALAKDAGRASPSANAGEPSGHIKEPYTLAEIKAKIASNDYSAEMLLQHAMLLLDSASLAASAGEPMFWVRLCGDGLYEGPIHNARIEEVRKQSGVWSPLYLAAPPTAQAEGWRDIATAPKDGVFLVYMQDEVRPARRMQVANWHPNVKIVGGLFSFDCATVTHWMPFPPPPTSAEGVE